MRHLNEAVSKATVIDFAHVKVLVDPLINRQLVTDISTDRTLPRRRVIPGGIRFTGIHLFHRVRSILSLYSPTWRRAVVVLGIVETILTQEEDVVNASAVATTLPVDVDTRVFPRVNLMVLVQVFYGV